MPGSLRAAGLAALVLPVWLAGAAAAADDGRVPLDGAPRLAFPVACAYGHDCFIQNYPDARPGGAYADHTCGHLSYDGHDGTDIRLRDLAQMKRGVAVRAAAAGVVRATRDGMPDVAVTRVDPAVIKGREAGNAVAIRHGGGWETQYSHLKRGSVAVRRGERVEAGQTIGAVGLSGRTEFPHVELSLRHRGTAVDPFTGRTPESGCDRAGTPLWTASAAARLDYIGSAVLSAGFAAGRPEAGAARRGRYAAGRLDPGADIVAFWVDLMGPAAGQLQRFRVTGPDGGTVVEHDERLKTDQARRFVYVGRRRPEGGWPRGCYIGRYTLLQDGAEITGTTVRVGIGASCAE